MSQNGTPSQALDLDMISNNDLMHLAIRVLLEISERNEISFDRCVSDLLAAYQNLIEEIHEG